MRFCYVPSRSCMPSDLRVGGLGAPTFQRWHLVPRPFLFYLKARRGLVFSTRALLTFWVGQVSVGEGVPSTVVCVAASLGSTHKMLITPSSPKL